MPSCLCGRSSRHASHSDFARQESPLGAAPLLRFLLLLCNTDTKLSLPPDEQREHLQKTSVSSATGKLASATASRSDDDSKQHRSAVKRLRSGRPPFRPTATAYRPRRLSPNGGPVRAASNSPRAAKLANSRGAITTAVCSGCHRRAPNAMQTRKRAPRRPPRPSAGCIDPAETVPNSFAETGGIAR